MHVVTNGMKHRSLAPLRNKGLVIIFGKLERIDRPGREPQYPTSR
jgi:hypothetical protein